jgi:hypothetical protein
MSLSEFEHSSNKACSLNELQAFLLVGAYLKRCLRFGNSNICLNELQAKLVARSNSFKLQRKLDRILRFILPDKGRRNFYWIFS